MPAADHAGFDQPALAEMIQILYVDGCPNLDQVREMVSRCLAMTGLSGSVKVEEIVGEFPSPTVLVDGIDITGGELPPQSSCRVEVATEAQLIAALQNRRPQVDPTLACSLTTSDLGTQLQRWEAIWEEAGIERLTTEDGVRMAFRDEPGVEAELQRLVTVENDCCPWAAWQVYREKGAVTLRVRSTGDGTLALHAMFGLELNAAPGPG